MEICMNVTAVIRVLKMHSLHILCKSVWCTICLHTYTRVRKERIRRRRNFPRARARAGEIASPETTTRRDPIIREIIADPASPPPPRQKGKFLLGVSRVRTRFSIRSERLKPILSCTGKFRGTGRAREKERDTFSRFQARYAHSVAIRNFPANMK